MKKENINDFRSEIFKLCNEIKKNDSLHIIQETLEKLFMCENIEEKIPSNIFFHQIAKHGNSKLIIKTFKLYGNRLFYFTSILHN